MALAGLLGVSVAGIATLLLTPEFTVAALVPELAKAFLQIGTVSAIGGTVSILTADFQRRNANRDKERDRERQAAQNRAEFVKQILARITDSYIATKRARRLLRARGITPPYTGATDSPSAVHREAYDLCMQALNEEQLRLETTAEEVETNADVFRESQELVGVITSMEKYLGEIITEYEQNRGSFAGDPPTLHVAKLRWLGDFVGPYSGSEFATRLSAGHRRALVLLRRSLLLPETEAGLPAKR